MRQFLANTGIRIISGAVEVRISPLLRLLQTLLKLRNASVVLL